MSEVAPATEWPSTFPLRKPITAYGEQTKELRLREPTGDDVIKNNLLEGFTAYNAAAVIMDLAAVPESALKAMDARDLIKLSAVLSRFFSEAAR